MSFSPPEMIAGKKVGFQIGPGGWLPDRDTVVFLHGAGGSRQTWQSQLCELPELNTAALELPGHGATPGPSHDILASYARWVRGVLEAWRPPGRTVLAGHSMGGAIALELGLTSPELLGGLILIGTGAELPVNPALLEGLRSSFPATVETIVRWCFHKETDPALPEAEKARMAANEPKVLIDDFTACAGFDKRNDVSRIGLPTLIICGSQDKMTRPGQSRFLADNIRGSRLELVDQAGHQVMQEQPSLVNGLIADFVLGR